MFYATAAALALVSLAAIPARGAVHQVIVGGPGILKYDPEFVTAAVGDSVVFTFKQKNHTATQSTFDNPCALAAGGFDSGFQPVADTTTDGFPVASLNVQDTNPIWVYCRQANHCQQGMVFAVNPGDKFAAFQAAATGGAANTTTAAATTTATQPPSTSTPSVVTVTATVTVSDGNVLTTTYASYPGSAQPTSGTSSDHLVVVGGPGKLLFTPSNITAQVGDTITFQFQQKNHTATQSSFAAPCRALTSTSTSGQLGFDSGFQPVADSATTFPTFTVKINDTAPIWAYCRQATHCGQGMVFAVNAIESGPNNFAAFQALAKQLNGTSGSSTSSGAAPTNTNAAAASVRVSYGTGFALSVVALVFGVML